RAWSLQEHRAYRELNDTRRCICHPRERGAPGSVQREPWRAIKRADPPTTVDWTARRAVAAKRRGVTRDLAEEERIAGAHQRYTRTWRACVLLTGPPGSARLSPFLSDRRLIASRD